MSQRTDAEFEHIIHDPDAVPAPAAESDDAIHLRDELNPAHATETGNCRSSPTVDPGMSDTITMYGTATCSDCARSKKLLDTMGVTYDYVDLNADEKSAETAFAISGRTSTPLIVFPDGTHVVEPTDPDLRAKVESLIAG